MDSNPDPRYGGGLQAAKVAFQKFGQPLTDFMRHLHKYGTFPTRAPRRKAKSKR